MLLTSTFVMKSSWGSVLDLQLIFFTQQVRLCREKKSGNIYAMKKLKKSEMLSRGQVRGDMFLTCYVYQMC